MRGTVLRSTLSLGRLNGIRIGVHVSWLALFAFVTVVLANDFAGLGPVTAYGLAAAYALCLFASVVAHELGHAAAAQRYGVRTSSIVLFFLGGVATIDEEPRTPRADAVVAAAGPAVSLLIAAGAAAALLLVSRLAPLPWRDLGAMFAAYVGIGNVVLALFNLLPAYPLDGGRVLRALLWKFGGDRTRATTIASRVGMGFGVAIVAASVLICAATHDLAYGWYAVLGAFVLRSGWSDELAYRRLRRGRPEQFATAA